MCLSFYFAYDPRYRITLHTMVIIIIIIIIIIITIIIIAAKV